MIRSSKFEVVSPDAILQHLKDSGLSVTDKIDPDVQSILDHPVVENIIAHGQNIAESTHPLVYTFMWVVVFIVALYFLTRRIQHCFREQQEVLSRKTK